MKPEQLSQKDLYLLLRGQIDDENQYIDHRVNWLLVSQGFLLVTFITVISLVSDKKIPDYFILVIPVVAIIINILSFLGISASMLYISDLLKFWKEALDKIEDQNELDKEEYPPIVGTPKLIIFNGGMGSTVTPIIYGSAWILFLIFGT